MSKVFHNERIVKKTINQKTLSMVVIKYLNLTSKCLYELVFDINFSSLFQSFMAWFVGTNISAIKLGLQLYFVDLKILEFENG